MKEPRQFGEDDRIPVCDRTSFGALTKVPIGSNPLRALGGSLRGVYNERFDGFVKLVNNFDVRLHFPALTFFNLATPGAVAYFDAGVYDRMTRKLQFDPVYCSAGLGRSFLSGVFLTALKAMFYLTTVYKKINQRKRILPQSPSDSDPRSLCL